MNQSKNGLKNQGCFGLNKPEVAVVQDLLKTSNLLNLRPVFIEEQVLNNCKMPAINVAPALNTPNLFSDTAT